MFKKYLLLLPLLFGLMACGGEDTPDNSEEELSKLKEEELQEPTEEVVMYTTRGGSTCKKPTTVADLSSGMQKLFYHVTKQNGLSLKVFGIGGVQLGKRETMLIVDFIQYKDKRCEKDDIRFGVGARLFLHIKKVRRGVSITELPQLAAAVESNKAEVTFQIKTIGITGNRVNEAMPSAGKFDVEAYSEVTSAVDRIQALTRDDMEGVVIDPQEIPVPEGEQ